MPEPEGNPGDLLPVTVRYRRDDLAILEQIEAQTRINYREYCRALVHALGRSWKQGFSIKLPIYVVTRDDYEELQRLRRRSR